MIATDLLLKDTVEQAFDLIKSRPDLIDQIFSGLSLAARDQIRDYASTMNPDVRLGWTQTTTSMPCVAIVQPGEQESAQYIGSEPGAMIDSETGDLIPSSYVEDGIYYEEQVAQFQGAIEIAVYSVNASETTWLISMIRWAMLFNRPALEDAGFLEQRLSLTDFMPDKEYPQPDQVYTRVVKLQYTALNYYTLEDDDSESLDSATHANVINLEDS